MPNDIQEKHNPTEPGPSNDGCCDGMYLPAAQVVMYSAKNVTSEIGFVGWSYYRPKIFTFHRREYKYNFALPPLYTHV